MRKMTDSEIIATLSQAKDDSVKYAGEFMEENERLLSAYYGDKVGEFKPNEGESSVVSNDIADVVEADMPSLARIFMGSGDILSFEALTDDPKAQQEAEDKTKFANWVINSQDNAFKIQHDWLKDAEIQKMGVVKYFYDEEKSIDVVEYNGVDEFELLQIKNALDTPDVEKIDVVEQEELAGETFNVKFKVTYNKKRIRIINVPTESFLISRNATSKDDAELVGDIIQKTRGELLADGFSRELIDRLPSTEKELDDRSQLNSIRNNDQGGSFDSEQIAGWASQKVEIMDLYCRLDVDGDGIAEARHIMISGNTVLENEYFNHRPYAMLSAILMPHKAIGRSRAEVTYPTQLKKTALERGLMNNIYRSNQPRNLVHDSVNLDDMLTHRLDGIVRVEDPAITPANAVYPLLTPYTGDKTLQVIQYADQSRAQTTGSLMASQGLDADAIAKETATRFTGVEKQGSEKIELIARNYAETGFKDLFEGIVWTATRYQNTEVEFLVLGKAMKFNPSEWRYGHTLKTNVGLGAGNNEALVASLQGIYQIQQQLKMQGSVLADEQGVYNSLKRITDGLGLPRVDEFFNNPKEPDDLLKAQNEQLNAMVMQMQEQIQGMQNPLAESEQIKAQAGLIKAQSDAQMKVLEMQQEQKQFMAELAQERQKMEETLALKLTELELKYQKDIDGAMV